MTKLTPERTPRTPAQLEAAARQLSEQQSVVAYDTKEFTIELLVQKMGLSPVRDSIKDKALVDMREKNGWEPPDTADIFIPTYQRAFSWDQMRQSRFIESALLGLPMPFLFFADCEDGRLEVVDGSQRLRTCVNFLNNRLLLVGCEQLSQLEGFYFSDLPVSAQRHFKNHTIRAVVLNKHASNDVRRDLFDRINTGPLIARPAEVRRGSNPGPVTDLIAELAVNEEFIRLCPMSEAAAKLRIREDLVTRYFAFGANLKDDLPKYQDQPRKYLDAWLKEANKRAVKNRKELSTLRSNFEAMITFVAKYFPSGFAKKQGSNFTPNVRFDAIACGVSEALRLRPKLVPKIRPAAWLDSDDFRIATTSSAANVRSSIVGRVTFVRDKLIEK